MPDAFRPSATLSLPAQRPLRVVLDTNAVMALWHFRDPKLEKLRGWAESEAVHLLTDERCLGELARVLAYYQFKIEPPAQAGLLAAYAARAECLPPPDEAQAAVLAGLPRCGDRDDQKFIELAVAGAAHLLVSRDKLVLKLARRRELREQLTILTPERLQQVLDTSVA